MLIPIDTLADPRLDDFREIKEKFLERQGLFLAEGENVVLRLLRSKIAVKSVLLAESRVAEIAPQVHALKGDAVTVYTLPGREVSNLLGFKFHAGVIATGIIPQSPTLEQVIPKVGPARLVVLPEIAASDNMGSLIRLSAGLGADGILVGERCTSPWMRRTVRVSMGTVFSLPMIRTDNLVADLGRLARDFGLTTVGTVLRDDAQILGTSDLGDRLAVAFGSEGQGLRDDEIAACQKLVTIPMSLGVDSLNVAVSSAVILWELFKRPKAGR